MENTPSRHNLNCTLSIHLHRPSSYHVSHLSQPAVRAAALKKKRSSLSSEPRVSKPKQIEPSPHQAISIKYSRTTKIRIQYSHLSPNICTCQPFVVFPTPTYTNTHTFSWNPPNPQTPSYLLLSLPIHDPSPQQHPPTTMVKEAQTQPDLPTPTRGLVVGNYCHDVLIRDDAVIAETLGGAASFVSNVLDGLSIQCDYVSKVGFDFAYSVPHAPFKDSNSKTTLFHAYFSSVPDKDGNRDRVLKRVHACEAISPSEIGNSRFEFGLAVGVGGEILPETLERMLDLCRVVFVDVQALIRVFDPVDGTVGHVGLRESGFFHLLPRIGFLKASSEEAPFVDLEEARRWCCVVVTDGKEGCRAYWKDGEMQISPFPTTQVDPTGAGDSFLGGLVAGLNWGLSLPDAALLGNFFGSLTVEQIGLPNFELWLLQRVREELLGRKLRRIGQCDTNIVRYDFRKSVEHEDLKASLSVAAKLHSTFDNQEYQCNLQSSPVQAVGQKMQTCSNCEQKLLVNACYEEPIQTVEDQT